MTIDRRHGAPRIFIEHGDPQPQRGGERLGLQAAVVQIVLGVDLVARVPQDAYQAVAERGGAAVADVQRPGRIGGHELQQHLAPASRLGAKGLALPQHLSDHRRPRRRRQAQVDEAGPGDLGGCDHLVRRERRGELLGDRPRRALELLGQAQRGAGGVVAMGGGGGALELRGIGGSAESCQGGPEQPLEPREDISRPGHAQLRDN